MKIRPSVRLNPKHGQEFKFSFKFPEGFILIIDSREQKPLFLDHLHKGLVIMRNTLEVGDYSIHGFESRIAIERKTLPDLLNCLGNERSRFKREMVNLYGYEWRAIVVESKESDLYQFYDFSLLHPESVRQSVVSINVRYGVQFYFNPDRKEIERWILDRFIKFFNVKRNG